MLSACGAPAAEQARYVGKVSPEISSGSSPCGDTSTATLTASKGHFTLTPTDGVLMLTGDVAPDGTLDATLALPGADRKPYPLRFTGRISDTTVTGRYVTPRCSFTLELHRDRSRQFEVPYL